MSIFTQRTAAVLSLAQIDATPCHKCGHALGKHLPRVSGDESCQQWEWTYKPNGWVDKQKFCKCKRFVESSEVLNV